VQRDILFLLKPGFEDPAYPGQVFYCPHCARVEGVLAGFPELAARLDVRRVAFRRPRAEVIEHVGEENQSLPALVLAPDAPAGLATGTHRGRGFVKGDAILDVLLRRHGFPAPHP